MLNSLRASVRPAARLCARPTALTAPSPLPRAAFTLSLRQASSKHFTKDHEWIEYDGATQVGTVGITDYAQKALGDVVYVELPEVDQEVGAGDHIGAVESVKAASDIFSPVAGIVREVNSKLDDQANLLNRSPEVEGWLAKIHLSTPAQLETLLSAEAYAAHCEGEDQ